MISVQLLIYASELRLSILGLFLKVSDVLPPEQRCVLTCHMVIGPPGIQSEL